MAIGMNGDGRAGARVDAGRGWLIGAGVLFIVLGVAALIWPFVATFTATLVVGTLLMASGIVAIGAGIGGRGHGRESYMILYGVLSLVVGLLIVFFPLSGAVTLTMLVAIWLGARGVLEIVAGTRARHGRGLLIGLGVLNIVFAIAIVATMPWAALTLPGYLLGFSLLLGGFAELGAANAGRRASVVRP